jgi:hypothetical protein
MNDFRTDQKTERCAACGLPFHCGAKAGDARCWCADLPPLHPVPGQTCLCPACLKDLARGRT